MRVSREQATQNRIRVVEAAGKLFRERGLDGVGVADIMGAAGLTHGGFYGQFGSKDELAAEACARALNCSGENWDALVRGRPDAALAAIVESYLSAGHRDDCGTSCLVPSLAVDVSRRDGPVRRIFTDGLNRLAAVLARVVPGQTEAARREKALATMASLVGAVVLARAVDDPSLSDEILAATARVIGAGAVPPRAREKPGVNS